MGRGRQKAKHQKVARRLKYHQSTIDISALERELTGGQDDREFGGLDYDGDYDGDDADEDDEFDDDEDDEPR